VYWYKKAANQDDAIAMYNLGLCNQNGTGVKKSNRWAKHYLQKSHQFGYKKAAKKLKELAL
jgi:TPR repeat protein